MSFPHPNPSPPERFRWTRRAESSDAGPTTRDAGTPGPDDDAHLLSRDGDDRQASTSGLGEGLDGTRGDDVDEEEPPKPEGIKIAGLDPIRAMYAVKSLQGFPEDEQDEVFYPYSDKHNDKVIIWRGDITTLQVDCIVNAANKSLLGGGGVDGAIHKAAGPRLYEECKTLGGAETGETRLTSAYRLPATWIAHTVGPIYSRMGKQTSEAKLRSCYRTTLDLCVEKGIKSVAFSGISTGVYGYPLDDAASIACDEVRKFLDGPDGDKIDHVVFCNFRQVDVNAYLDNLPSYFPPPRPTPMETDSASTSHAREDSDRDEGREEPAKENQSEGQGGSSPRKRSSSSPKKQVKKTKSA
ncbi:hypothetical protein JCM10212_003661 [Sporobolomyces blumeae]